MAMRETDRLLETYLPPRDGFVLESFVATTYKIDWEFVEEELLAPALGVRSPVSRLSAFRSELERRLERSEITIIYDIRGSERQRLSPQIDPVPIVGRKLHAKITLLLWSEIVESNQEPRKLARLIVGSANLTRMGFRQNYEVVSAIDFAGRGSPSNQLLLDAVQLIRDITTGVRPPRLENQLRDFERFAKGLPEVEPSETYPWKFVNAGSALRTLQDAWKSFGELTPQTIRIASPFWPEGDDAAMPVARIVNWFGLPNKMELICQGKIGTNGRNIIPIFPSSLITGLQKQMDCPLFVKPAHPNYGVKEENLSDSGEVTEDERLDRSALTPIQARRDLHGKVIAICGQRGSVLYIGSSNYTRRGLGLSVNGEIRGEGGNWEAGFVYKLSPRQSAIIDEILAFAGPSIEIQPDKHFQVQELQRDPDPPAPTFLHEIVAEEAKITIRFQNDEQIPEDLIILMPNRLDKDQYLILFDRKQGSPSRNPYIT